MADKNWSEYQLNIFKEIANGSGHLIVDAKAGAGKTTTAVEAVKYCKKPCKILFLAFNKSIATELDNRINKSYIHTSTIHSLGLNNIKRNLGNNVKVDFLKSIKIIKKLIKKEEQNQYKLIYNLDRTAMLCKAYLYDTPKKIEEIIINFGIELFNYSLEDFIKLIVKIITISKLDIYNVDFPDMLVHNIYYNYEQLKYDYVFVDEAQDTTIVQTHLIYNSCKQNGRIVCFADPFQAIYQFCGSDSDAVSKIQKRLNAKVLPLSVSYRCAKNIIKLAQTIVPAIQARIDAPSGKVEEINEKRFLNFVKEGDFVLSRTNAPLIKYCLRLLKMGVKANIQGKDLGADLILLINKSKKKSLPEFEKWLDRWYKGEEQKLLSKNKNTDILSDRFSCLQELCEDSKNINDLKQKIKHLFDDTDDKKIVIFSSIHKAKGQERDRVFLLQFSFRGSTSQEELNVRYVAITRAKQELYLVVK